ncbi:MAG: homoserine dehydrogenase, partial [Terriglobia bacterium]
DQNIDIVAEVIGGTDPAKSFILGAIRAGKSVVTANKEIMASFGKEILEAAEQNQVDLFFEASVGGGIPIIQPLKESLVGNKILKVMGIVNGTTNYILTKMSEGGLDFDRALKDAQRLGYAERDPRADVEGEDAAAKIAILASIAFNSRVTYSQVFRQGISKVSPADLTYAREMGYEIKLVAVAKEVDEGLDVRVHPLMIVREHPLAGVKDAYNAIFLEGDAVGEVMFFGAGAGSLPTASAVVGDIVEAARNLGTGRSGLLGCTCYGELKVRAIGETVSSYYVRLEAVDEPGVLAKIAKAFGDAGVSISSMIQKGPRGAKAELVFITHNVRDGDLNSALSAVDGLEVVKVVRSVIRVEAGQDE